MATPREAGWGAHEKATRYRQAEEQKRVVKPDANQAFVFKRQTQPKPQQQQQQQNTYAPLASPPAAATPTVEVPSAPAQSPSSAQSWNEPDHPASSSAAAPTTDMSDSKYPSVSPAHARESVGKSVSAATVASSSAQSNILCSCLVELFEMIGSNPAPKAYGPKGVTLLRIPNSGATEGGDIPWLFQMLVYAPVSKKPEFSVEVNADFSFTMVSSPQAQQRE
jgi:hypothetical protein